MTPVRRAKALAPGFTLIELIMVILILGIISIILLPKFFPSSTLTDRGYYDDFLQSARYARDVALARGCRVQAVIYSADFYFMQDADCDSSVYSRATYIQAVMRPDQSHRLEYHLFDEEGHDPITLANEILIFESNGTLQRDNAGSLESFDSISMSLGPRSISFYGDTGYVQ